VHGWVLPGAPDSCQHIVDLNGGHPTTLMQVYRFPAPSSLTTPFFSFISRSRRLRLPPLEVQVVPTLSNGSYLLSFSYAGHAVPDVAPRHAKAPFQTLQVYWDGTLLGKMPFSHKKVDDHGGVRWTVVLEGTGHCWWSERSLSGYPVGEAYMHA
jgi:hypothetical protein